MFTAINTIFDRAMTPLAQWPAEVSCALWSILIGFVLLIFFKYVSMQDRIDVVKNRMTACVLGVWLFRREPRMIGRCQAGAVGHGLHYLGLNIVPLTIMALPMMLVLSQMNAYLAHRPIPVGGESIVTARLTPRAAGATDVKMSVPEGVSIIARNDDPDGREIAWRIKCDHAVNGVLSVSTDGQSFAKSLAVGGSTAQRIEPLRNQGGFWHQLLYPSEPPIADGAAVESIKVDYPERELKLLVWPLNWLYSCFVVMLVAVLVLRKPLGVSI